MSGNNGLPRWRVALEALGLLLALLLALAWFADPWFALVGLVSPHPAAAGLVAAATLLAALFLGLCCIVSYAYQRRYGEPL